MTKMDNAKKSQTTDKAVVRPNNESLVSSLNESTRISLDVGEPNFPTPDAFAQGAIRCIENGSVRYTDARGLYELRCEISKYVGILSEVEYSPFDEIMITSGASEGIDAILRAICSSGDEIILPSPSFSAYMPLINLCKAKAVPVECTRENGYVLTAQALKNAITDKTKAVILSYPNNPTGAIIDKRSLQEIAECIKNHNLLAISDEIYAELVFDGKKFSSISAIDGMQERTIIVSGFSKSFAMTGWRVGYVCAPKEIIESILNVHAYSVMCASACSQYVALEALRRSFAEDFATVKKMKDAYCVRRDYLYDRIRECGLNCFKPLGALYAFPDVRSTGMDGNRFAKELLRLKNVSVLPGSSFGGDSDYNVRISYAVSQNALIKGMRQIEAFINGG